MTVKHCGANTLILLPWQRRVAAEIKPVCPGCCEKIAECGRAGNPEGHRIAPLEDDGAVYVEPNGE